MNKRILSIVGLAFLMLVASACSSRRYTTNLRVYAADQGNQETFYDTSAQHIVHDNVWVFMPDGTYVAHLTVDSQTRNWSGEYDAHTQGKDFVIAVDTNGDGEYEETLYVKGDVSIEWRRSSGTLTYYLSLPSDGSTE